VDQDGEAIGFARERLEGWGDRFMAVRSNFSEVVPVLRGMGIGEVRGVLLDLGVSSRQLDAAGRGFSFRQEGPRDMRMDSRGGVTAADLVNGWDGAELERIFREYGEEPHARRIAGAVVRARERGVIRTTLEFAAVVEGVVPRTGRIHPATRVFQALRMAVNREMEVLEKGLKELMGLLEPGGRMAVITFHSLEDRMVKRYFAKITAETVDRPEWPEARQNPDWEAVRVTRKAVVAGDREIGNNPRARSAKLRVVEKRKGGS
jgi:16S rRNA (cytosine1402-N4)-methyltransferase